MPPIFARVKTEIIPKITGKDGNGPLRVYIHKVHSYLTAFPFL